MPDKGASAAQLQQALTLIHAGQLRQADGLCRQVLALEERNFNAHQLLGHIALQGREYAAAVERLSAARSINPASAAVHSNLAVALLALERPAEALQSCETALRLKPDFPEAHCNRGNALCVLGRPVEGLAAYDRALTTSPGFFDAHVGRAKSLLALKRYTEAQSSCDWALKLAPGNIDAWCLRGSVLLKGRHPEGALAAFDRALALSPDSPEALNNRGTALRDLRRPSEALESYERALGLRPQFAEVWCNAANLSMDAGKYEQALGRCDRALAIQPDFLDALNLRGTALRVLRRYEAAAATYERILAVSPLFGQAQSHLLAARANLCDWSQRSEQVSHIVERIIRGQNASAPHAFLWTSDSAEAQLRCAASFTAEQFPEAPPLWQGQVSGHERLRVAYLSADFTDHPVAHLIAGVVERHDRRRFETFGVSLYKDPAGGAMQLRMQQAFEHFHDVSEAGDRDVAGMLREWEIDIAVDLTGHTRGGRLGILAFRPAPLQVNYLGFAGTCGATYVDYLIGDRVVVPADQERFFSERIVRMPHSFMPSDDGQVIAAESPRRCDLGLPESGFVFCAFNNAYKLNPTLFDVWMGLLRDTPGSVLWLRGGETVQANLRREASARGIAPERLIFAPKIPAMDEHLARYGQADLFLDTLPYGAHATACDALRAGLPVLTCLGNAFASRVAGSLLTALGLPELVTANLEEYRVRALEYANSPDSLARVRTSLTNRLPACPVFDTDLYRTHLETAYRLMWERRQRGTAPESFSVPA
jgi:predicted O-linked N-acetylglucosamine transferase (SPINDLY family)